jgi:L-fucose mutarotase/ribose pyranase (RbsD/FucU family)
MRRLLSLLLIPLHLHAQSFWQDKLARDLPLLGHRDWIVVADAAYPLKNSPGLEVVATGLNQPDLLAAVLKSLASARHLRPVFFTDSELPFVPDQDANGISSYRAQLAVLLKGGETASLPQAQIEAKVEDASRAYHVLVLKSATTLPYTAVYIDLVPSYWSTDAEKRLRAAMQPR